MSILTGRSLDWAITFAAGMGFLLFGYGKQISQTRNLYRVQGTTDRFDRPRSHERSAHRICLH